MNFRAFWLRARERRKYWQAAPLQSIAWVALTAFLTFASAGLASDLSTGLLRPFWWAMTRTMLFGLAAAGAIVALLRIPKARLLISALLLVVLVVLPRIDTLFIANPAVLNPAVDLVRRRLGIEGLILSFSAAAGWSIFVIFAGTQGMRHVRERTELELAERVQQTLAPPLKLRIEGYEIHGRSVPSSQMGGDLLDAVDSAGSAACYIADVAGHGVAAGVFMGMVKSAARTALLRPVPAAQLLADLNRVLFEIKGASATYVTFACVRCREGGRVEYALAGNGPILHYRARTKTVERLEMEQFPLGLFVNATFESGEIEAEAGDLLALMTDGLPEAANAADEEFGLERMAEIIAQNAGSSLSRIADRLFEAVWRHGAQTDDETVLLVAVRGARA